MSLGKIYTRLPVLPDTHSSCPVTFFNLYFLIKQGLMNSHTRTYNQFGRIWFRWRPFLRVGFLRVSEVEGWLYNMVAHRIWNAFLFTSRNGHWQWLFCLFWLRSVMISIHIFLMMLGQGKALILPPYCQGLGVGWLPVAKSSSSESLYSFSSSRTCLLLCSAVQVGTGFAIRTGTHFCLGFEFCLCSTEICNKRL